MAELFNFGSGAWTTAIEYPFGSKPYLSLYDMVYVREILSYLVIGGMSGEDLSQIARFTNGAWYDAGQLYKARGVRVPSFLFGSKLSNLRHFKPSGSTMLSSLQVDGNIR